jgi:hypothetical protein
MSRTPKKVSVIMPAYNHGPYIGEAIQSVCDQTFDDWELIIVNDGSTDSTANAIAQFDDPRIYSIFQTNNGVSAARNAGIEVSAGEYLAFLDADDLLHQRNLEIQATRLDQNPEIGVTYVSRIEMDQDRKPLRFHRPPLRLTLKDLVLGFPICPSDFMIRREWIDRAGVFNRSYTINEDRDFFLRLALSGCLFTGTDQFLSFHRFYSGRTFQDLPEKLNQMLQVLHSAFTDPCCPPEITDLHDLAHRNIYVEWAYQASVTNETDLALQYFRQALHHDQTMETNPDELFQRLVEASTRDGGEHETRLRMAYSQLPLELKKSQEHCEWALAYGYLHQGLRDFMWDRIEQGEMHCNKAIDLKLQLDERTVRMLRFQLLAYRAGIKPEKMRKALRNFFPYLVQIGGRKGALALCGSYFSNRYTRFLKRFFSVFQFIPRMFFTEIPLAQKSRNK